LVNQLQIQKQIQRLEPKPKLAEEEKILRPKNSSANCKKLLRANEF